jgi:hypothetical protein
MIQFETIFWCQEFEQLELATCSLRSYENQRQEIHNDQKVLLSRLSCLRFIEEHRDLHGNGDLVARVWFLRRQLENNEPSCAESLVRDLTGMKNQLKAALARKRFAFIPYPNDQYFEQDKLFGERVYEAFPQAREDVKSAGNAIAAELYTASVFHLMRVSEYGLRALARRLRVRLTDKHRPQRLEYADWNRIIDACKGQISASRKLSHGPKKQNALELYSEMADRCEYIKDIWRNEASHTRRAYACHDVLGALERVKGFMVLLAERVLI